LLGSTPGGSPSAGESCKAEKSPDTCQLRFTGSPGCTLAGSPLNPSMLGGLEGGTTVTVKVAVPGWSLVSVGIALNVNSIGPLAAGVIRTLVPERLFASTPSGRPSAGEMRIAEQSPSTCQERTTSCPSGTVARSAEKELMVTGMNARCTRGTGPPAFLLRRLPFPEHLRPESHLYGGAALFLRVLGPYGALRLAVDDGKDVLGGFDPGALLAALDDEPHLLAVEAGRVDRHRRGPAVCERLRPSAGSRADRRPLPSV